MEPYEGSLRAAIEFLRSANRSAGEAPRVTLELAHKAVHNFAEALAKFGGRRGKIAHRRVAEAAEGFGFPGDLVDAIGAVEDMVGTVYGGPVGEEDARRALETANRLARLVSKRVPVPGERAGAGKRKTPPRNH